MANIAVVLHWPPPAMYDLPLSELMYWHEQARLRVPSQED